MVTIHFQSNRSLSRSDAIPGVDGICIAQQGACHHAHLRLCHLMKVPTPSLAKQGGQVHRVLKTSETGWLPAQQAMVDLFVPQEWGEPGMVAKTPNPSINRGKLLGHLFRGDGRKPVLIREEACMPLVEEATFPVEEEFLVHILGCSHVRCLSFSFIYSYGRWYTDSLPAGCVRSH